ncbi:preprotein translocase subunit SecG [uncultured Roseibium sp.]|uniref:preprotein translocase subunit SecG n=1 Tax=uncultured Roseibium sp. TaxID=1936171 RepID=UPI00262547A2|nr:preprotein translocase subunit SecG [uncultured Roseibium sp.]
METVVIVIHLMVVLALVLVVLLQRSEGGALGIGGGGGGGGLMSSRGTANILTRATAVLAVAFFATSLALSLIAQNEDSPASILDAVPATTDGAPATDDGAPAGGSGGILDSLRQQSEPSGPQVPAAQ